MEDLNAPPLPSEPATPIHAAVPGNRTERFVTFQLGETTYAVLAAAVSEVTHTLPLTPLPSPLPGVVGISPLRGEILAVLDIKRLLGESVGGMPDPRSKQIVMKRSSADAAPTAFLVDRLGEIAAISVSRIRPTKGGCELVIGETEAEGRSVKVVSHAKLVAAAAPD